MPDTRHHSMFLALLLLAATVGAQASAGGDPVLDVLGTLQHAWAETVYDTPEDHQDAAFAALEKRAEALSTNHPDRAEPLVWQAIILSSHAGASGGLSALSRVKEAKALLERAESIAPEILDGSVYTSLGSLYYKVPGWPIGFGNDKMAERYLKRALLANPAGIDANYFYGDYLYEQGRYEEALNYLQRALDAPPRPRRELADRGRRDEVRAVLERTRAKL